MIQRDPKFMLLLQEMLINSREIVALLTEYNILLGNLPAAPSPQNDTEDRTDEDATERSG